MPIDPLSFRTFTWVAIAVALLAQIHPFFWWRKRLRKAPAWMRVAPWLYLAGGLWAFSASDIGGLYKIWFDFPREPATWRLLSAMWIAGSFCSYLAFLGALLFKYVTHAPGYERAWWEKLLRRRKATPTTASGADRRGLLPRRDLVTGLTAAATTAAFSAAGYGVLIGRESFRVEEVDMPVRDLPEDLDGLRITQLTDVHLGPYLSTKQLDYVVAMANETRPHLAVLTGDYVTTAADPLDTCLEHLARLRADAGILGCLGNHERFAKAEDHATEYGRRLGIEMLRQCAEPLRFGDGTLNVCGVDYQRRGRPYLEGAENWMDSGAVNLLLTHNPDVFPAAAALDYDLVLAGHTHGGQVTVEIVDQWVNAGRFFTPYVRGLYHHERTSLYVSPGIGTVNLPMRIGALPEIALIRLRRVSG